MKRTLCLWSICAVLGLFGAGCGDDSSDSGAEVPAMTCKGKNVGDKCNADGSKTCQKVEGKTDLECKNKPTASEDPCKGKNEGDNCKEDGTKTCQKIEGKEGLQCEDKPAASEDPCKGKNEGDNCKEDGTKTCQKVEGKTDLECKDAVVDPNKCTPGITRCAAGDSQGVELCLAGGTWGPVTACQEENGAKTTCFKVGENKAECHRPCGKSAKEGENATCQQTGDAHESAVTVCGKAIGGELYVVEKKVYPCHSACTDGKCDFVNFCLKAEDGMGVCANVHGVGYEGACSNGKIEYLQDAHECGVVAGQVKNEIGTICVKAAGADRYSCGCIDDSHCRGGFKCRIPGWNPEFPNDGGYCYDPAEQNGQQQ